MRCTCLLNVIVIWSWITRFCISFILVYFKTVNYNISFSDVSMYDRSTSSYWGSRDRLFKPMRPGVAFAHALLNRAYRRRWWKSSSEGNTGRTLDGWESSPLHACVQGVMRALRWSADMLNCIVIGSFAHVSQRRLLALVLRRRRWNSIVVSSPPWTAMISSRGLDSRELQCCFYTDECHL